MMQLDLLAINPRPTQVAPAAATAYQERIGQREDRASCEQSAHAATYPFVAGSKEHTTSREAAEAIESTGRAELLRTRCLDAIKDSIFGLTADEAANYIAETPFAVRPRITELKQRGLIRETGTRRKNASGVSAKVWEAA